MYSSTMIRLCTMSIRQIALKSLVSSMRMEAQLACGLLRSNGIPCELSSTVLPGLPADIILWTDNRDAEKAWALLVDTEREARTMDDDAA